MTKEEISERLSEYETYQKWNGVDENLMEVLETAVRLADECKDPDFTVSVAHRAMDAAREYIRTKSKVSFEKLEEYSQENKQGFKIINQYYGCMRYAAKYELDSFCLYIERYRPRRERFYEPRRKRLKMIVDAIQDLEDNKLDELYLHEPPRTGKLLADDTPVMTSEGWKKHGDLKVGDKVVGSDGKYTEVTHVFPKDVADYKVTLSDGSEFYCHGNHEWTVYNRHNVNKLETHETHAMLEKGLIQTCGNKKRYMFMLPLREPMQGADKVLNVHPYVLGAWLGDGTNTKPWITDPESDYAIIDKIIECGYSLRKTYTHKTTGVKGFVFDNKLKDDLRSYGMCYYTHTTEKHIPQVYLTASIEQRLELLAGLLDTDGTLVRKEHRYSFSTSSERLKDDVVALINTFGWRVCVTEYEPHTSSFGITGKKTSYRISFNPTMEIPCVLERKQLKVFSERRRIAIVSIEKCEPKPGNCISVANTDGLYAVGKAMHLTHNSQIVTFATTWHIARNDEPSNLYVTYSNTLGGAFVDGVMEIIKDPTYAFSEVFPYESIAHTDSEAHRLNLTRRKKYATLSGRGMEAGLNGQFDAKGWLILDDLHEGINEVLNQDLLAKKLKFFNNNVLSRQKQGCKILGIGTIWSLNDIFCTRHDFLEAGLAAPGTRYKIIKIPAMNEKDESNFDYDYGVGFSTAKYKEIRARFENDGDLASWSAQYMQEPVEREGAVFIPDDMRYYNGILPSEEPLKVCCACDVALGGDDYLSFPIAYVYEDGSVYIDDVVYDNSEKKFTKPQVVNKIIEHHVTSGYFEANQGGEGYKDEVNQALLEKGIKINLRSEYAPTDKRKAQRIWDKAGSIREYYFRDLSCRNKQYRQFMTNLFSFNFKANQKHKHQDAADSLASLAYFLEGTWANAKVEAAINPFRRKQYGY